MFKIRIALCASLMMMLSGCASKQLMLPTPSPDLMQPPCKASNAGTDTDSDLQSDTETIECLRSLRLDKYRWQAYYRAISR